VAEIDASVESETATGVEIASFALSTALATTLAVVAITAVVGTIFSSCFVVIFSVGLLSTTWFSAWSSLFFFQKRP
jgi:hypothetical protein